MEIRIDRASPVPVYKQIVLGIRQMILAGRLPEGFRLPPERRLAEALGVNRSTVLAAYRELKSEALLDAHVGRGTAVASRTRGGLPSGAVQPLRWGQLAREDAPGTEDPLVRDFLELTERKDLIALALGLPAPDLLPLTDFRELEDAVETELGPDLLLHSPTEGVTAFRETLCQLLIARGIDCDLQEVMVTSGSQQALDLIARVLVEPGDVVLVEEPSYFGALQVFRHAHARLLGIPTDGEGMQIEVLEALLARHQPKLIYTLPTFQNPSGAVMSLDRRRRLLELAYRYQVPILEDDPYSELRYEGQAIPSLKALDREGFVIYVSSFSKVLFPGLRVAFMAAPRPLVRLVALIKQCSDLHSSTAAQWLVERFIRTGRFARHMDRMRQAYGTRRTAMAEALAENAPPRLSWALPQGGFYFWCRAETVVPHSRLLALAAERQVSYLPGQPCFLEDPGPTYLRLNFTFPTPEQIRSGIPRLMEALREAAEEPRTRRRFAGGTLPIV